MPEDTAFLCEQFIGTAFLCDLAGSQDYDLVSILHGAHTMGDDQNGLVLQQPRQCALDLRFVLYVERSGRLIQENDGAFFSSALAIEMRWRSPPESFAPF